MNILYPLEKLLGILFEFNYALTHNYGLALILLSIMVSSILLPIYKLADTWREREKSHQLRMQADLVAIKQNYLGKEKYYALKTCYRIYGYNPLMALRTSLGFLIQIPFFFAAYQLLSHYAAYEEVGFLWISNLSRPDNGLYGINILPIIMTVCNIIAAIVYSSNTNNTKDSMKECIHLCIMSIAFLLLLYKSASGLLIYWTMNNIYALIKYAIQKKPSIAAVINTTQSLGRHIIQHPYTRYVYIGIGILVGNYVYMYASHSWRNAPLAKVSIDTAILLCYLLIIYMYAIRGHIKNKRCIGTNLGSMLCVLMSIGGVWILWNVISQNTDIDDGHNKSLLSITPNRIRQFIFASQMLCIGILFPSFMRIWKQLGSSGASIKHTLIHQAILFQKSSRKHYYTYGLILSFFIACMFIIVSPLSIYISEPKRISNSIYNVIPRVLIVALIVFIFLMALFVVIRKKKLLTYITFSMLSAWTIVSMLYGYIIPLHTGGILGNYFSQDALLRAVSPLLISFELSAVILGVALIVRYFRNIQRLWAYVMLGISIVGAVSTIHMLYKQRILFATKNELSENMLPAYHDTFMSFSKEKNILLIVLDAIPADLLPYLMDTHPEMSAYFDGFTWYKNTVSMMPSTHSALPFIIGGHQFQNSNTSQLEKAKQAYAMWAERLDDYSVFYYNPTANEEAYPEIIPYINDNFDNAFATQQNTDYVPYWKTHKLGYEKDHDVFDNVPYFLTRPLYAFSLFRTLPLSYKQKLYQDKSWGDFINSSSSIGYYQHQRKRYMSDDVVLDSLAHLITADSPKKTFKIYWGESTHPAFYLNQSCQVAYKEMVEGSFDLHSFDSMMNALLCNFERVEKWFEKMKEIGIYDNTKIVIVSDHGRHNSFTTEEKKDAFVLDNEGNNIINNEQFIEHRRMFALLMVKDFKEHGAMKISSRLMSNADVPSILASGTSEHKFPELIQDPITLSEEAARNRTLSYYGANPPITVQSDVYDIDHWIR